MILTGPEIERCVRDGEIEITPYDPAQVGPNSYDVRLDKPMAMYSLGPEGVLDMRQELGIMWFTIPESGFVLRPGVLYLGSTVEATYTPNHVPCLEGRSSEGRLGVQVHMTAGVGDCGFRGQWTLEISVVQPVHRSQNHCAAGVAADAPPSSIAPEP